MRVIDATSLPREPLEALRELARAGEEIEELRRQQVAAARRRGASWEQIGESLGMSRQSAWEYYTRDARAALEDSAGGAELSEDDAMQVATEEVSQVRRRRRRASP